MSNTNQPAFPSTITDDSLHVQGMNLREYAAIKLKVASSGNDELDFLILESLRNDLAAKAMQAYTSDPDWRVNMDPEETARAAYAMADALMEAGGQ
jgi:hypothetical protein